MDEKVAELHLAHVGAELTIVKGQEQADYIGVPVKGPFKREESTVTNFEYLILGF